MNHLKQLVIASASVATPPKQTPPNLLPAHETARRPSVGQTATTRDRLGRS